MSVPSPSPSPSRRIGLTRSPAGSYLSSGVGNTQVNSSTPNNKSLIPTRKSSNQLSGAGGGDYMIRTSSAISSDSSSSIQLPNFNHNSNSFISPSNSNSFSHSNSSNNFEFTTPSPSFSRPGIGRRRSTDVSTSGGLDYYWSSLAGVGASSSSSSLGISSSPISTSNSNFMLNIPNQGGNSISPVGSFERDSKNVGNLINEEFVTSQGMGMSFSPSSIESFNLNKKIREYKSTGNLRSPTKSKGFNSGYMKEEMQKLSLDDKHYNTDNYPRNTAKTMDSPKYDQHEKEEKTPKQPDYQSQSPHSLSLNTNSTKALNINYPSRNDSNDNSRRKESKSPSGWSDTSHYSHNDESAPQSAISSSSHLSAPPPPWKTRNGQEQGSDSGDESSESNYSPIGFKIPGKFDFEQELTDGGFMDNSNQQEIQNIVNSDDSDIRASIQSTSTYRQSNLNPQLDMEDSNTNYRTPIAYTNQQDRPEIRPPRLSLNQDFHSLSGYSSPSSSTNGGMSTPKRSPHSRNGAGSSNGHYTPTTANRAHLGLGFDIPQIPSGSGSGSISPARSPSSPGHGQQHDQYEVSSAPRSAPANKLDFIELGTKSEEKHEEDEDTLRRNNRRSTLPAITSISSGSLVEHVTSQSKENLLSPDKYTNRSGAVTPVRDGSGERRGSTPSPNRSPEPPPRSALRQLPNATNIEARISNASSRRPSSPQSLTQTLPVITHTPNSPMPSPDRSKTSEQDITAVNLDKPQPKRPDRSPDRQYSPIFSSSATINDLTDILGGAIDAIGLIDSRDTPPPTISEPNKKEKPSTVNLTLKLQPPAEVFGDNIRDNGPMTPTSLPTRGASLPVTNTNMNISTSNSTATPTQEQTQAQSLQQQQSYSRPTQSRQSTSTQQKPELRQKASSIFSFSSISKEHIQQSPTLSITVRPWPSAMLYGNIKSLKHSGDRAKGYAKAINELSRSESGLREWCIASVSQANRGGPTKSSALSSLGVRANSVPSAIPLPCQLATHDPTIPHSRNVSAGSEFPMRADSYTAREISQRVLDPEDQPTSLPSNLPYPQLQLQQGYLSSPSGLKPSQSMQSVSSFTSSMSIPSKKSFFNAIGHKKGNNIKKESLSLGPPTGQIISTPMNSANSSNSNSSMNKKDIRGLPISGPRSSSPQKLPPSAASGEGGRIQGGPLGPRGPRGVGSGSFTPPPPSSNHRNSIEMISGGRSSLDTGLSKITQQQQRNNSRGSLDGTAISNSAIPPPRSSSSGQNTPIPPSRLGGTGIGTPKEDDIRQMSDILPHVERSVLRNYLGRYGDTMTAIGVYLEDEKNGSVIR